MGQSWAGQAGQGGDLRSQEPNAMLVPWSGHWSKGKVHRLPLEFTSFPGYEQKEEVIREINDNYQAELEALAYAYPEHTVEMSGSRARWPEVLAIYAVKITSDPDHAQEVATINDEKKAMLEDIFRKMNTTCIIVCCH